MSIQSNFPAIKPTLLLDFANVEQLDPRITFTRASTATYYNTQTAKAEENLVLQSQTFDAASWPPNGATVTANTSTAPDGTSTADKLVETAVTSDHNVPQSVATVSGATYTFSCFVKAAERGFAFLRANNSTFDAVSVNLTTGSASLANGSPAAIVSTASVDGWWRVSFSFVASSTATLVLIQTSTDGMWINRQYAGTAGSGILIWGAQVEQRASVTSYTPTTTQPITNYIPVLQTAAAGVPRFDHNPTTFESLGLEVEEQRTNLLTYSEMFSDAAWAKINATITANTIVAPDGALTGDKLVSSLTTSFMGVNRLSVSVVSGNSYTMTAYVKAGEWRYAYLQVGGTSWTSQGQNSGIRFDLISGTVAGAYNGQSTANGSISNEGNGWFRISAVWTCNFTTPAGAVIIGMTNTNNTVASTGDGYSGIFIWGAQFEAGADPTSYIPTVASQVTRAVDSASMTGTNFSSWYNAAEGTLFVEMQKLTVETSGFPRAVALHDGTVSNTIQIVWNNSVSRFYGDVQVGGVSQADLGANGTTQTNVNKLAFGYLTNNFGASVNGASAATDVSGNVPSGITAFRLGAAPGGSGQINGYIRKIAYYPMRVTNAQLQSLTT